MTTGYFITGTDTGVGKTYITSLLLKSLVKMGKRACGFKPICCGDRDDVFALLKAGSTDPQLTPEAINPIWLRPPAAPYTACIIEERVVDIPFIHEHLQRLTSFEFVLVEGAGGWRVPIRQDYFISDLAKEIGFPVIIVARLGLGTLNHTLLTVDSIRSTGLPIAGIIVNDAEGTADPIAASTNPALLEQLTGEKILGTIGKGEMEIDWPLG
ncbi:MAG: dethiobiotin synthase [Verrucomicrobiota bacterium]|nr:dethiobiotin synthase [Verrucomicrobiota bacterium]